MQFNSVARHCFTFDFIGKCLISWYFILFFCLSNTCFCYPLHSPPCLNTYTKQNSKRRLVMRNDCGNTISVREGRSKKSIKKEKKKEKAAALTFNMLIHVTHSQVLQNTRELLIFLSRTHLTWVCTHTTHTNTHTNTHIRTFLYIWGCMHIKGFPYIMLKLWSDLWDRAL